MMTDFVNQCVADDGVERLAGLAPVIEQGPAIEEDAVDIIGRVAHAFPVERDSLIQAEQIEGAVELHFGLDLGVGKILDQDNHVLHMSAQALGNPRQRALGYYMNVRIAWRLTERLLHGATIARLMARIKRSQIELPPDEAEGFVADVCANPPEIWYD